MFRAVRTALHRAVPDIQDVIERMERFADGREAAEYYRRVASSEARLPADMPELQKMFDAYVQYYASVLDQRVFCAEYVLHMESRMRGILAKHKSQLRRLYAHANRALKAVTRDPAVRPPLQRMMEVASAAGDRGMRLSDALMRLSERVLDVPAVAVKDPTTRGTVSVADAERDPAQPTVPPTVLVQEFSERAVVNAARARSDDPLEAEWERFVRDATRRLGLFRGTNANAAAEAVLQDDVIDNRVLGGVLRAVVKDEKFIRSFEGYEMVMMFLKMYVLYLRANFMTAFVTRRLHEHVEDYFTQMYFRVSYEYGDGDVTRWMREWDERLDAERDGLHLSGEHKLKERMRKDTVFLVT